MAFVPVLAAVGAGLSAIGTISGGIAASNASNYQAEIARNNAIIANQNAVAAGEAGEQQAINQSLKGAAISAKIKAAQAANGIDVNSGSAVDVQESQREVNKLDTENVEHNALLEAYGYKTQATNFTAQAGLDQAQAGQELIGGFLGGTGSLLSNASSISTKWGSSTGAGWDMGTNSPNSPA